MINEQNNQAILFRFLLEELPPEESEEFEIRLLEDAELQDLVEAAELELIDDYLCGELSAAEADRFERHFLNSPTRRRKLELARIFPGTNRPDCVENTPDNVVPLVSPRKPPTISPKTTALRPALRIAAGLLFVLGMGIVLRQFAWPAWQTSQGMALLNDAYRKGRPIEARLSGFDHAPWEKDRGPGDERTDPLLRDRGALTLLDVASAHPNAKTYRALGSSYLLKREFKQAIEQFEKSLQYDPNNPLTHNDLGAALMESAQSKQHQLDRLQEKSTPAAEQLSSEIFSDLSLANEHFSQALQLDANLKDAIFNQAICLERLGLLDPALRSWEKYLELDPAGGWREEAQERIEALKKQKQKVTFDKDRIFQDFLAACESGVEEDIWQAFLTGSQMRGNFITERLLDEYLELLTQRNRVDAMKKLDLLATAGRIEAEKSGDPYTRDFVALYRSVSPRQVALLSAARRTYRNGIERSRTARQEALVLCQRASEQFAQAGSGIETALADLAAGTIYARLSDYKTARQISERVAKYADEKKYLYLSARSFVILADLCYSQNSMAQALMYSHHSLKIAERRKDDNIRVGVLDQLVHAYSLLGSYDRALNYALQLLVVFYKKPIEPGMLWVSYGYSAEILSRTSRLFTSLMFEKEALQLALAMNGPLQISRSYGFLSDVLAKLNNYPEAISFAQKDLDIGNQYSGDPVSENIKAHALLRLGHLFREIGRINESLQAYDECIRISESRGILYNLLNASYGRLLLYLKNQDYSSAQIELEKAITLFEQNRNQIDDNDLRIDFFETGHHIYDQGIELAVTVKGDYQKAFEYSEQGRSRSLRDLLQEADGQLPPKANHGLGSVITDSSQLFSRIPASAQIIQYSALNQYLYTWVVSKTDFAGFRQPIRVEDLNHKVTEYLVCIKDPKLAQRTTFLAEDLYNILIKPLEGRLDPNKEVFIIADKPFHQLPFGALIEPLTGKYLVEKYVISYSPSTTVFLHCTDAAKLKAGVSVERFLSVGESVFRQPYLQNSDLPSTKKEAEQVALHYGSKAELLLDNMATEPAIREGMKTAEVIHIATHGLINERRPEYSGLALWEEPGLTASDADGMLYAWEVSRSKLPHVRLVILSTCQSLVGREYKGEGMMGMARSFLAAGAPLVVASLWKVDSQVTAKFMDDFHTRRTQSGMTTAKALCETQRAMLKNNSANDRRPSAWAGFTALGGYAQY